MRNSPHEEITQLRLMVRIADCLEAAGPQGFAAFLFWACPMRNATGVSPGPGLSFQSLSTPPLAGRQRQRISISVPHARRSKNRVRVRRGNLLTCAFSASPVNALVNPSREDKKESRSGAERKFIERARSHVGFLPFPIIRVRCGTGNPRCFALPRGRHRGR